LKGVQIDSEVTLNAKGLIRLIGSTNTKTGTIVAIVDSLDKFDVERVSPIITKSPATQNGNDVVSERNDQDSQTGPRLSELADTPTQFPFITTQVIGTVNRQVILLRFPINAPSSDVREKLLCLQAENCLAPFVVFESFSQFDRAYYALSPTAVEIEHLAKLLKNFPEAKSAYQKFGTRYLPLPIHYVCEVGLRTTGYPTYVLSQAHTRLLNRVVSGLRFEGHTCGNALLKIGMGERVT
jgi:hypothetical protein